MELSITISDVRSPGAPIVFQGDLTAQIRKAQRLGFSQVELHVRDPKGLDLGSLVQALEGTSLQVSTLGTGQAYTLDGLSFACSDAAVRAEAVKRIKAHIQLAQILGAKVIIGTIKGRLGSAAEGRQAAYRHVVDSLLCCLEEAERCGVQLCVEAINRYEADFLNTAAEAVSFIEQFGSKQVGLLLDTFHMNIEEACLMGPIRQYAEYLFHVHLADSNRLAPGWGHLDFPSLLRELSAAGYRGSLGLEYLPLPSPEESAGQGVTYLRRLPQG